MPVSFLHTADWQIAKAFAKFPDDAAVKLRQQRIDTIKKIAQLATERQVDAVLVAGDVFDLSAPADKTIRLVINAMSGFKGRWLLLPGNHDPAIPDGVWSQLRRVGLPENIHIVDEPKPFWLVEDEVLIMPAPLLRKHEANDLTEWFGDTATAEHVIRIGLAHGSVDNRLPDRGDAPNTISDRRAEIADLDYLALGDWHGTQKIGAKTWYSGAHETDRFRDNDSGNVLHVCIEKHGAEPTVEIVPTGRYRWRQICPQLHGEQSDEELHKILETLGEPFEDLILQIIPRGTANLHSKHKIANVIANWEAKVSNLEYVEDGLVAEATKAELSAMADTGFLAQAVERLHGISADPAHPEQQSAQLALQLLFAEHKLLESRK